MATKIAAVIFLASWLVDGVVGWSVDGKRRACPFGNAHAPHIN